MKKTIVVSAISLRSGGTLSILNDCLRELKTSRYSDYIIYAIIKDKCLLDDSYPNIQFVERNGVGFYLRRLYYEYFYFYFLSKRLNPYLWLSLHDISPNVHAKVRAVYCHNPTPFYRASLRDFIDDITFGMSTLLYKYLYRINIRKNDYVIVQQDWIRRWFRDQFKLSATKVVVAHPYLAETPIESSSTNEEVSTFIYPAFPRVFKNFELIGEAINILLKRNFSNFQVVITIDGTENRYSRFIKEKYGQLKPLKFIGQKSRTEIYQLYSKIDTLIFPSKLETWGLPLSEFKNTNKLILASELPYARETIGDYDHAVFFSPYLPSDLADKMEMIMTKSKSQFVVTKVIAKPIPKPMANDWQELFEILLHKKNEF